MSQALVGSVLEQVKAKFESEEEPPVKDKGKGKDKGKEKAGELWGCKSQYIKLHQPAMLAGELHIELLLCVLSFLSAAADPDLQSRLTDCLMEIMRNQTMMLDKITAWPPPHILISPGQVGPKSPHLHQCPHITRKWITFSK